MSQATSGSPPLSDDSMTDVSAPAPAGLEEIGAKVVDLARAIGGHGAPGGLAELAEIARDLKSLTKDLKKEMKEMRKEMRELKEMTSARFDELEIRARVVEHNTRAFAMNKAKRASFSPGDAGPPAVLSPFLDVRDGTEIPLENPASAGVTPGCFPATVPQGESITAPAVVALRAAVGLPALDDRSAAFRKSTLLGHIGL